MSIVSELLPEMDDILGIRDDLGAIKYSVNFLTRTWSGSKRGEGNPVDVVVQMLPTPNVRDMNLSYKVREGGAIKQGDLILKSISRESYPDETDVNCSVTAANIEKFYYIDGNLYEVISTERKLLTWIVQVRKTSKQKTYIAG